MCTRQNVMQSVINRATGEIRWQFLGSEISLTHSIDDEIKFHTQTDKYKLVPCGQCAECRLQRSRQWADRMMLEAQEHNNNYFVTLTYDNDNIPEPQCDYHSLKVKDLQQFFKNLRQQTNLKFRYYACGEYGPLHLRPHYHIIMFGLDLDPDSFYESFESGAGKTHYVSPDIQKAWHKGFTSISEVNWETCAYTARYVQKKLTGELSSFYDDRDIIPPFSVMSRKPGIGRKYYDNHKEDIYKNREIFISTDKGSRKLKPSRYYDKLYDLDYPDKSAKYKSKLEKKIVDDYLLRKSQSDLTCIEQNLAREYTIKQRNNRLKRGDL